MLFPNVEDFVSMTILKEVCFSQLLLLRLPIIYLKEQPGASHIFQHRASFIPELFKMRRSETGYFFELGGKVCHTAIVHEVSYFRKVEFIIDQ